MIFKKKLNRYFKEIIPFRAAVTAVVISVLASVGVSAVSESGKQIISSEMDAMGMNGMAAAAFSRTGENKTDINFYNSILALDTTAATPVITENTTAVFQNGISMETISWGINQQAADIVSLEVTEGRMINSADTDSNAFVCLVDENVAQKVYKRGNICGKRVSLEINGKAMEFTIIGTVKKASNILNSFAGGVIPDFIYVPYTTMKLLSSKGNFDRIIFTSNNTTWDTLKFKDKLTDISHKYRTQTISLTNLSSQKEQINNIADTAFISLFIVSVVAVVVCSISVASSVNTAVITKQKDIGIKMSMGAGRFDITSEFMLSAVISCLTGVIISAVITFLAMIIFKRILPYRLVFDYSLIAISVSATIIMTAIFSFLPSYRAAKMPPLKALNRE